MNRRSVIGLFLAVLVVASFSTSAAAWAPSWDQSSDVEVEINGERTVELYIYENEENRDYKEKVEFEVRGNISEYVTMPNEVILGENESTKTVKITIDSANLNLDEGSSGSIYAVHGPMDSDGSGTEVEYTSDISFKVVEPDNPGGGLIPGIPAWILGLGSFALVGGVGFFMWKRRDDDDEEGSRYQ